MVDVSKLKTAVLHLLNDGGWPLCFRKLFGLDNTITEEIGDILEKFDIQEKVVTITDDNAAKTNVAVLHSQHCCSIALKSPSGQEELQQCWCGLRGKWTSKYYFIAQFHAKLSLINKLQGNVYQLKTKLHY